MNFLRRTSRLFSDAVGRANPLAVWLILWLSIWPLNLAGAFYQGLAGLLLWLAALLLSLGRPTKTRLLKAALFFLILWGLILLAFNPQGAPRLMARLFYGLGLGLNMITAVSPLKLAKSLARLTRPVLGEKGALKLALSVALLIKLVPVVINSAFEIKKTLAHRAPRLSFHQKIIFWSRSLLRQTLAMENDLSLSLLKRELDWV